MNAIPFDTLKLARGFEAAGMSPAMANGSADALAVAMKDTDCATKADIAAVKADLSLGRTEFQGEFEKLRLEFKAGFATVHADLELLRRDMTIKLGGMIFLAAGLTIAAMRFIPPPH
jgi:hypothetical protein